MGETLWLWDITRLQLAAVIVHKAPIKQIAWDPTQSRVAFCTGNSMLYLWSPEGASCVEVPADNFSIQNLKWNCNGNGLLLIDKDKFCSCFIDLA
jgi:WD40 repeat protein